MNYFVTGIDTDSGKSLVSAILCEALHADYWKPIQAGIPTDTEYISSLISNRSTKFHPESFLLNTPASPHAAAAKENLTISLDRVKIPQTSNDLIIEGAGGCLVPINDHQFVIDLAAQMHCQLIVVADLYLGSINHTLLTWKELKTRKLPVLGIIFNGEENVGSQRIILKHTGWRQLLHIKRETIINQETVLYYATELMKNWNA